MCSIVFNSVSFKNVCLKFSCLLSLLLIILFSFLRYSQCANSVVGFLFFSFFHCSTFIYLYIHILLLSRRTLSTFVSRLHPVSKRRSTRRKHIYTYIYINVCIKKGNENKLQLVFFDL